MSDLCFEKGSGPVQSFELDGYLFTDVDGTSCYSEGDLIRDQEGRILDPNGPEVEAFKKEWKINDLTEINIGAANAVMNAYRKAELFAAKGQMTKVNKYVDTIHRQTRWSGLVLDQERIDCIIETAKTQALKVDNSETWFSDLIDLVRLSFPMKIFAGLNPFDSQGSTSKTI